MSAVKTIKLEGFLGEKYAKTVKLAFENRMQMLAGLEHRFGPEIIEDIRLNDWHLVVGKKKKGNDRTEDTMDDPFTEKTVHLVPAIRGESSAWSMILGVVLVIVGVFTSWAGGAFLIGAGAALIAGGAVQMLIQPPPGGPDQKTDKGERVFNGAVNITSQGGPVPLVYGHHPRVSSVVISSDFSSDRIG